jgi:hypothetical protein
VIAVEWLDTVQTLSLLPLSWLVVINSSSVVEVLVNVVAVSVFARLDDEAVEMFTKPKQSLLDRWSLYTGSEEDLRRSGTIEVEPWIAPKYVSMRQAPSEEEKGWLKNLRDRCNPENWVNKKVKVYFVCPVTHDCPGEGYELTLPRNWDKKYGLALRIRLSNPQKKVPASYAEIEQIGELVQDPYLIRSGLVKAIGPDGSTAYVAPRVMDLYEKEGEKCIGLSDEEVERKIHQLIMDENADSANAEEDVGGLQEDAQNAVETERVGGGEPASSDGNPSYVSKTDDKEEDENIEYEA